MPTARIPQNYNTKIESCHNCYRTHLYARKKIHTAQEAMAPVPNLDLEDSSSGYSMVRDHSGRFLPNLRDALYRRQDQLTGYGHVPVYMT